MEPSEQALSQDVVFDLLSSPRRRYVLYHLRQVDEPIELTTLAEQVAAWENETTIEDLTEQQRKRVYVSLYQTHVPKLDDAGVVAYDQDSGLVELTDGARQIDEYLVQPDRQVTWRRVYVLLGVLGAAILALTTLEVAVFAAVPEAVTAAVVVVLFLLVAVAHYLSERRRRATIPPELQRRR
jgi:hypothetical protein